MKILVYTRSPWDDRNAVGNTYSNWFDGDCWEKDEFYNFYMRTALPNNNVCSNYYCVTIKDLVKHFFMKERIGKSFTITPEEMRQLKDVSEQADEEKMIAKLHKNSSNVAYALMERLCNSGLWINKRFVKYLKNMQPDVFFATAADNGMLYKLIRAVKKYTKAKIVLFIADDVYGKYCSLPSYRGRLLKKNFERIMHEADHLYGASDVLCDAYSKLFQSPVHVLYKGCTFSNPITNSTNKPLKLVYAGNLLYGRTEILSQLADQLVLLKQDGLDAQLEIYSGAAKSEEIVKKLERDGVSFFRGRRQYEEITQILSESDIVLHVESFDKKQIDYVHYSFSTKIIDCLQSGSVLMVIGPKGIASVEYARNIPGSIVVDNLNDLKGTLERLRDFDFTWAASSIRKFALEKHEIQSVHNKLKSDFLKLCNK